MSLDLANPQASLPSKKAASFADMIRSKISTILVGKKSDDFITRLVSLTQQDPNLQNCLPMSLVSAALQAQSLNLELNKMMGQAWIVPFKDKKIKEINPRTGEPFLMATFQVGYKGYLQLAMRSGNYKKINVLAIKEGELRAYDPFFEEIHVELIQDEVERENAPAMGYYAMFEYLNGFRKAMYWSKAKMANHADRYSQAFSLEAKPGKYPKMSFADFEAGKVPENDMWLYSSFWYKDFDAMAYKTMLRQLLTKWGIMSVEMPIFQATQYDMRVAEDIGHFGEIVDTDYAQEPEQQALEQAEEPITINLASPPAKEKIKQPKAEKKAASVEMAGQFITCPKNGELVDEIDCLSRPCRAGCPAFE